MKLILPVILIIISILTFIFGVNPLYKDVKILRSDISVYNTALSNSTNLQKTQGELLTSYNQISTEDLERLSNFLPSSVNNIEFILEVERIAGLHSMPIKDIKFETAKKDNKQPVVDNIINAENINDNKPYNVFPIEFSTEGNYDSFLGFLKDLEHNLRLVDVKSVSFSVPEETATQVQGFDPNNYRYTIKAETYWLK